MAFCDFGAMLVRAKQGGYAVGAFNIVNYLTTRSAIRTAEEMESPIILQTSVSTVKQFGVSELADMLEVLRKNARVPVATHLDHCTDPELAKACVDSGWDAVMIDISARPFAENIRVTKEVQEYAHRHGVCVEGELGIIGGVEDNIFADEEHRAGYEESIRYLEETGIDAFAPSIGTAHGLYKKAVELDYDLICKLRDSSEVPVVVHGGTGLADEQFRELVRCGAAKINISTAVKYGYIDGLKEYLAKKPMEYNPLKLDAWAERSVNNVVRRHIELFGSAGKA